jgi:hypothetical protein
MPTSKPETKLLKTLSYPDCEEGWEEAGYRPPRQVWQSGFTRKAAIPERNPAETLIRAPRLPQVVSVESKCLAKRRHLRTNGFRFTEVIAQDAVNAE